MKYNKCPLYSIHSKRVLCHILSIKNKKLLEQDYVARLIEPYVDYENKPRLIEPPLFELKQVQNRIKNSLYHIDIPDYVFSGVKGRSYVGNALLHAESKARFLFKIDLTAFFPSISRGAVYHFL